MNLDLGAMYAFYKITTLIYTMEVPTRRLEEEGHFFLYLRRVTIVKVAWCTVHSNPRTEILIGVVYSPERDGEPNSNKFCNSIPSIDTDNAIVDVDFNFINIDFG